MNMLTIRICTILFFMASFIHSSSCTKESGKGEQSFTKIRIINNSFEHFTNVSLFSMPFGALNPGDTTAYTDLKFDSLRDDPMIYCVNKGRNLGRYIEIPGEEVKYASYVIDSLYNGVLYVAYHEDGTN